MKNTFKLLLIITTLSFSLSNANALTIQDIAEKALNSTVVVVVEDKQGNTLKFGSGFVVGGGAVVSNHHVISGGASGYVIHNDKVFKILGILASDYKNDLVLLKIDKHKIPPLSIYKADDLKIGANVFVAGNPLGMSGTFSEGMLSSIRNIEGKELYQITAPISQGSSGGPLLNNNGDVIGVVVSNLEGGQNINFAVPSTYLNFLIKNIGSLRPLSSITPKKAEAIESIAINNEPLINEEGKLTDICCAFGIELGKKLNPELLDTKTLVEEELNELSIEQLEALLLEEEWSPLNRSAIKLVLEYKEWLEIMLELYPDRDETSLTTGSNPKMDSLEKLIIKEEEGFNRWIEILTVPYYERKDSPEPNFAYDFVPENPYQGFDIYKVYLVDEDSLIYRIIAMGKCENMELCDKEKDILVDIIKDKYAYKTINQTRETATFYFGNNKKIIVNSGIDDFVLIYQDSELESLKDMIYMKKLKSQRNTSGI